MWQCEMAGGRGSGMAAGEHGGGSKYLASRHRKSLK
jgi:hypothetical protein